MNKTLQDRLVKELRLRGISSIEAGNVYLPEFIADYNRRFAREPMNPHDAHRPLQPGEDLPHTSPAPPSSPDRLGQALAATLPLDRGAGAVAAFMERFSAEQKAKRKKSNDVTNQWKRERELLVRCQVQTPTIARYPRTPAGAVGDRSRDAPRDTVGYLDRWSCTRENQRTEGNLASGTPTTKRLTWITPAQWLNNASAVGGISLIDDLSRDGNLRAAFANEGGIGLFEPLADGILNANLTDINDFVYVLNGLSPSLCRNGGGWPWNCTLPPSLP